MYKNAMYQVILNQRIAKDIYKMILKGDTQFLTRPGQFVNIRIAGQYLRRPISVCDWDAHSFTIIYKVVGRGTKRMAAMTTGTELDILTGLGNGFDVNAAVGKQVVLIGGGVGVPPMYALAKALLAENILPAVVLGFNDADSVFYREEFEALGLQVYVTTVDGSLGIKGFVTDALKAISYDYYYCCGPQPMLRAVWQTGVPGELSFEERMGCGFGACMGCSCKTLTGNKRICVDGPVMKREEVIFE